MNLQVVSYNDVDLNNELFQVYFPVPSVMTGPDVDIGEVERSYFHPNTTYKKRKSKYLFIHIKMLGVIPSDIDTLNALFNPYDPDFHELLVQDLNDNNKQYYVMGTPAGHPSWEGQELVVSVKVDDSIWKTKQEIETTWLVTETGDQETITVGGSFYSEPTFEITPAAAKAGGKAYRIFCPIYNPSTIAYENLPLDIVNDALDTAALIADNANKCQINQVGGIGPGDTTIPYDTVTGTLPSAGMGYVDTEQIIWTGKTGTTSGNLTGCARGVNGTSAAAHADDTEIKVSKMEADGGDVQITVDGVQVNFWLQDINNATTQIWTNHTFSPGQNSTLGTAIASAGAISSITLENSAANIDVINAMPSAGIIKIGSELFSYTSKNVTIRQFTGIARAVYGTAMSAHGVSDAVHWIEKEIFVYHGAHGLPAFVVDDNYKPMFELSSTNASWHYHNFLTTNASSATITTRTGRWNADGVYGGSSEKYYDSMTVTAPLTQRSNGYVGRTFSVMGMFRNLTGGSYNIFPLTHPLGFTSISADGYKYQSTGGSWATIAGVDGVFNEGAPGTLDSAVAWSQSSVAISPKKTTLNFTLYRPLFDSTYIAIEMDNVTVAIDATDALVMSIGPSIEYYHVNANLVNATTGEYIALDYNLNLGATLIVDTARKVIIDEESGAYERGAMALSSHRHDWLKMTPGANVLQWDESGAAGLTIMVKRRERKL